VKFSIEVQTPTNQLGLAVGQCATLACVLEATAPKPGNVHRGADFEDLTYLDLVLSGIMIGPEMERAAQRPLGETVLAAVRATRRVIATNSNLGIILLLAPLTAAADESFPDRMAGARPAATDGVRRVLDGLTRDDARLVYDAIRLAKPGGMGKVETADVAGQPPESLIEAMRLAADRDLVARQYAGGFAEVFGDVVPALRDALARFPLYQSIVYAYLQVLARHPDSLIARKCGLDTARRASDQAAQIIASAQPTDDHWHELVADFDFWLRSDGHRRNPGTTADLITAGLFVTLWEGSLRLPTAEP
jgi:triphosphoribosyl-dephospho-CoA synthase